ncbi:hypothetical protein M0805_006842 [Coniferiporia weirii]|nr:hypothetical protein M0805_006842 [Coniferiporia weirii]
MYGSSLSSFVRGFGTGFLALPSSEKTVTHTETLSVRVPPASNTSPSPASTRPAEFPLPVSFTLPPEPASIPTHVYEVIVEDAPELELELEEEDEEETVTIRRSVRPTTRRRLW